jgi:hypothetical protein
MLKVGQVLYKRYEGLIKRDGGTGGNWMPERVRIDHIANGCLTIEGCLFTIEPDMFGRSYKTYFSEE